MALPRTQADAEAILEAYFRSRRDDIPMTVMDGYRRFVLNGPWPDYVHYGQGCIVYTSPEMFCTLSIDGPSDCRWMVPGTLDQ